MDKARLAVCGHPINISADAPRGGFAALRGTVLG